MPRTNEEDDVLKMVEEDGEEKKMVSCGSRRGTR